jgi:hypothetical protein
MYPGSFASEITHREASLLEGRSIPSLTGSLGINGRSWISCHLADPFDSVSLPNGGRTSRAHFREFPLAKGSRRAISFSLPRISTAVVNSPICSLAAFSSSASGIQVPSLQSVFHPAEGLVSPRLQPICLHTRFPAHNIQRLTPQQPKHNISLLRRVLHLWLGPIGPCVLSGPIRLPPWLTDYWKSVSKKTGAGIPFATALSQGGCVYSTLRFEFVSGKSTLQSGCRDVWQSRIVALRRRYIFGQEDFDL